MEQHQHLSVNEFDEVIFLKNPCCVFYSLVDLIVLSSLILSSLSFVDHIIECAFICFLVPSLVASLPLTITIMAKT